MGYAVCESSKLPGWEQGFVVVRGGRAFLRFVGNDGQNYRLMTATAGGDWPGLKPCQDTARLSEAAERLAKAHGLSASADHDRDGRLYVMPFEVKQEPGETDKDFSEAVVGYFDDFFRIYDGLT